MEIRGDLILFLLLPFLRIAASKATHESSISRIDNLRHDVNTRPEPAPSFRGDAASRSQSLTHRVGNLFSSLEQFSSGWASERVKRSKADGPLKTANSVKPRSIDAPQPRPFTSSNNDVVDVWILAGQSNTVGYNSADGQPMPDMSQPLPGRILSFGPEGAWGDAQPSIHYNVHGFNQKDAVGPDMAFAHTLLQLGTSRRVGLIPTAAGGTNLYSQWQPGGALYSYMVAQTRLALALMSSARLRGMIWVQGESDAQIEAGQANADAYGQHFTAWAQRMRSDLSDYHPSLPIIMPVMATRDRHAIFPFIDTIRAQQQELQLPDLLKIDMAGYELFYEVAAGQPQLVHLSKAGQCALGAAMAHSWYVYQAQQQPPSSVSRAGAAS